MPNNEVKLNGEVAQILQQLASIRTTLVPLATMPDRVARMEQRLDDMGVPDAARCALHGEKIKNIEADVKDIKSQVTMDRKVTVGVSAVTAAVIVALKWLVGK